MRIDSHVHVWRAAEGETPGVRTTVSPQSDVRVELLREYMDEHGVDRAVLVQPLFRGEDNSYVADCARADREGFAAVCVVDPRVAGAAERLAYWVTERGCRGLRLRPVVKEEAATFGHPDTFALWRAAGELGVVVSILANQEHLATVGELAQRFPQVPIVIDHFAHPKLAEGGVAGAEALLNLAQHSSVFAKLSGFYYVSRERFPYDDCRDLVRAVYDAFGPERLLWGSDFPHVVLHTTYGRSVRFLEEHGGFRSREELLAIMGGNAARLYWGGGRGCVGAESHRVAPAGTPPHPSAFGGHPLPPGERDGL